MRGRLGRRLKDGPRLRDRLGRPKDWLMLRNRLEMLKGGLRRLRDGLRRLRDGLRRLRDGLRRLRDGLRRRLKDGFKSFRRLKDVLKIRKKVNSSRLKCKHFEIL